MSKEVVIVDATRTAIGSFGGSIAFLSAAELGKHVIEFLIKRNDIDPKSVSEVIMGQVLTGASGQNPARQASIKAGIPSEVPAYTVGKVCGSGLKAIALGAQSIIAGDNDIVIAGGQESMSSSHHALFLRNGTKFGDVMMVDMMLKDGLSDAFHNYSMGITAENVSKNYGISREEQDKFACNSQNKAELAQKNGKFKDEISTILISNKKGDIVFDNDEFIRAGTNIETLARLKPAFMKEGSVTAGNSSGINDGAAALLIMSGETANKLNKKPIAKISAHAVAGVDPAVMGIGPAEAVKKVLTKCNWKIEDLDLIEANEAFAAQAIAVNRILDWDVSKVNVNGGAIAIGHPIGASGARITTTLLYEMKRRQAKKALATLCIGGGMGIAMCFEMC